MKVLMLSGRFGFGHEMAANAVREALKRQDQKIEIVQKDLPEYFYPHISKLIYKVFGLVAERCHGIYNLIYKISGRMNSGTRPGGPLIYRKFQKMMEEYMPDVIVCTHPFCMKAAATYKAKSDSRIPLVTCITDISMHKEWYAKQTDLYLAPTKEVKDNLVSLGAAPENVMVDEIVYKNETTAEAALLGAYVRLNSLFAGAPNDQNNYANTGYVCLLGDLGTENLKAQTNSDWALHVETADFTQDDHEGFIRSLWTGGYNAIDYANNVIVGVTRFGEYSEAKMAQHIAEAKFLRGYEYFLMLQVFSSTHSIFSIII